MHELGLCRDMLDAVQRRAGDRPVARVRVRVGRLQSGDDELVLELIEYRV